MTTPIEQMLGQAVDWKNEAAPAQPDPEGLPHVTHSGVLELAGSSLRCYRLSNGQAIFNAEDVDRFFAELGPLC